MLELKKAKDVAEDEFLNNWKSLGRDADITASRQEITIACKHIKEILTQKKVHKALKKKSEKKQWKSYEKPMVRRRALSSV